MICCSVDLFIFWSLLLFICWAVELLKFLFVKLLNCWTYEFELLDPTSSASVHPSISHKLLRQMPMLYWQLCRTLGLWPHIGWPCGRLSIGYVSMVGFSLVPKKYRNGTSVWYLPTYLRQCVYGYLSHLKSDFRTSKRKKFLVHEWVLMNWFFPEN